MVSTTSKKVKSNWEILVDRFGSEVKVLLEAELDGIEGVEPNVISAIRKFREGKVRVVPGGGGEYGKIEILAEETDDMAVAQNLDEPQRSLFEY